MPEKGDRQPDIFSLLSADPGIKAALDDFESNTKQHDGNITGKIVQDWILHGCIIESNKDGITKISIPNTDCPSRPAKAYVCQDDSGLCWRLTYETGKHHRICGTVNYQKTFTPKEQDGRSTLLSPQINICYLYKASIDGGMKKYRPQGIEVNLGIGIDPNLCNAKFDEVGRLTSLKFYADATNTLQEDILLQDERDRIIDENPKPEAEQYYEHAQATEQDRVKKRRKSLEVSLCIPKGEMGSASAGLNTSEDVNFLNYKSNHNDTKGQSEVYSIIVGEREIAIKDQTELLVVTTGKCDPDVLPDLKMVIPKTLDMIRLGRIVTVSDDRKWMQVLQVLKTAY